MKSGIVMEVEVMQERIAVVEQQRDEACAAAYGFELACEEARRQLLEARDRYQRTIGELQVASVINKRG